MSKLFLPIAVFESVLCLIHQASSRLSRAPAAENHRRSPVSNSCLIRDSVAVPLQSVPCLPEALGCKGDEEMG